MQNASVLLDEFHNKLNELKSKSIQISEEYLSAKDKVEHHKLLSKVLRKPFDEKIISDVPNLQTYIKKITAIEKEIIKLRNHYHKLLKESANVA